MRQAFTAIIALTMTSLVHAAEPRSYTQMCDASAAVMVDDSEFIVANDEDNILRTFSLDSNDPITSREIDLTQFLVSGEREADIEGAAKVGNRIYWITSHGANRNGKERLERRRFFATDLKAGNNGLEVVPAGIAYTELVADLAALPELVPLGLLDKAKIAPEEGGLNIEGLAEGPDGSLLIGFRSPLAHGKAILVPLLNPNEVIGGIRPRLGRPDFLDLGGLGIRSIEATSDGTWLVSAGPVGTGPFAMFSRVQSNDNPSGYEVRKLQVEAGDISPEAIALTDTELLLLSDDGDVIIDGTACKELGKNARRFRGMRIARPDK